VEEARSSKVEGVRSYTYLEDYAIADIAFEAEGTDQADVFIASAEATMNVMIEDIGAIEARERRTISLVNSQVDMLLFDLLQELIYYKDAEQLLLRVQDLAITERDGEYRLQASGAGERLDPTRHQQRADVKAVTLHRFTLEKSADGWKALVILDV
jgi:SHS2 domain-containing protein